MMNTSLEFDDLTIGLDVRYFNDEDIFGKVRDNIYFKTWQIACHSSQVSRVGDYFSFSIFDQDIFIVRGSDNMLRAFYNVCQHRGHRLVDGQGSKRSIVCPYHAWTYDLEGRLKRAPNSDKVEGFDALKICVPQIRLEEFLGFVFVNLDENCATMDEMYPGVRRAVLKLCPDIEQRQFAHEHTAEEGCNWLIAVENYNECYHCRMVHREFAKGVIDPKSYRIVPFGDGKVLKHSSKAAKEDTAWMNHGDSDYGSFFLWPSFSVQVYPGGIVNSYHWRPLGVDDTRVHRGWYSSDGTVDESLQKVIDLDRDTTFAEDLSLVRNVQRGITSRGYTPGPLIIDKNGSIDSELSIAALHQWMRAGVD